MSTQFPLRFKCNQTSCSLLAIAGVISLFAGLISDAQAQIQNTTTSYAYDAMGNLTTVTDPLNNATQYQYDALNRRIKGTDANAGITQLNYNGQSQLTGVTDPRNLVTTYQIDGLGNQTSLTSPDTGTTNRTFDAAGNLLTSTDAKGQLTTYTYDVLSRLSTISYADGQTVTYQYDQGANGIGRLSSITDSSGSTTYTYDQYGQVLTDVRVINGISYTTTYTYDNASQLASVTYPSGRQVTYARDGLGRITQITSINNGNTVTLVANVTYAPTGKVLSYVNGAGNTVQYTTDLNGRTTSYSINQQTRSLGYDAGSRLTTQTDPALSVTYGYDVLNRLNSAISSVGSTTSYSYNYDAVGNRTVMGNGSTNTNYTYGTSSNQLTQVAGSQTYPVPSDLNGSITSNNPNNQLTYDARGRMVAAQTAIGAVQYQINALGQRVLKVTPTATTIYNYDLSGKLIGEVTGAKGSDYMYLNDMPIAVAQH